jgi:hypothetical protein
VSGLEQLLGGDLGKSIGGLIQQFESGTAHEVSPEDAAAHHDAVAKHLSPQDYEQAAIEAASKLTPAQRKELAEKLTHAAKAKGKQVRAPAAQHGEQPPSADDVGKLLAGLQGSGGLTNVAGELLGNPTVRSALVGVAGTAAKKLL